jgi:hypothetical protein
MSDGGKMKLLCLCGIWSRVEGDGLADGKLREAPQNSAPAVTPEPRASEDAASTWWTIHRPYTPAKMDS